MPYSYFRSAEEHLLSPKWGQNWSMLYVCCSAIVGCTVQSTSFPALLFVLSSFKNMLLKQFDIQGVGLNACGKEHVCLLQCACFAYSYMNIKTETMIYLYV